MADYLKIEYRNSCDLGGSVFGYAPRPFAYTLFLDVDLGRGSYEIIEQGRELGNKTFVREFARLQRDYSFDVIVPEYLYDCLCHIQLHDMIVITTKYDEQARAYNFKVGAPEWNKAVCKVNISFTVDYTVNSGCCQSGALVYERCLTCGDVDVIDLIEYTDPILDTSATDTALIDTIDFFRYYMVHYTDSNGVETWQLNKFYLPLKKWIIVDGSELAGSAVCFTHGGINWKFYYTGTCWKPYQVISSIANVAATIVVKGYCLPYTWVQLQISTDGVNYSNTGAVTVGTIFSSLGIAISGLTPGTLYYFRFVLYNNNCNYGYSNVRTITKT